MARTTFFVKGRKDGVLRQVQHLPKNSDLKTSPVLDADGKTVAGYSLMLLGDPAVDVLRTQAINNDRIIKVVNEAVGLPE